MNGVLQPAGPAAQTIAGIGWLLILGAAVVFAGVMLLLAWALRAGTGPPRSRSGWWIAAGGVVFPGAVLAALFAYTAPLAPAWRPVPPPGALVVSVTAHMWWWEVHYHGEEGEIVTANEIRIPVGRPVYLALASSDVIHSFWIPALAGKMDMVPGRVHHLQLRADRPGVYRGQCAEFCGRQHALMALHVVAQAPAEFGAWLRAQAQPAASPATPRQAQGRDLFLAHRCDACHRVRGTGTPGPLGPDLTHVASRLHLGAGTLQNGSGALARWVAHVQTVKPGARMPSYERLHPEELAALSDWLGSLQ